MLHPQRLLPSRHLPLNFIRRISVPSEIGPCPLADADLLDHLLQQSTFLHHVKQVHAHAILTGNSGSGFLVARIISLYSRFSRIALSRKVFDDSLPGCASNMLFWNSIVRASVAHQCYGDALHLFVKMRQLGVFGDAFTFPLVARASGYVGDFEFCRVVHGLALGMDFGGHIFVANELVGMYVKLGRMDDGWKVLERMRVRNHISWNTLVSGYASNCDCDGALELFRRMEEDRLEPNVVTWVSLMSSHARAGRNEETLRLFGLMKRKGAEVNAEALAVVLSACSDIGAFDMGKVLHGCVIKGGFERYLFVTNALIGLHGECGDVNDALMLFRDMKHKNLVSWNALITSYVDGGLCDEALQIFSRLQMLRCSTKLRPDVVTWSALISGFASEGRGEVSLELFRQMQRSEGSVSAITISIILSVCAEFAALNLGREIHAHVIRTSIDSNILVGNGLVNMYYKCGSLRAGHLVFDTIKNKDLISWNSIITGYGAHGLGVDALEAFDQMIKCGWKPDGITFVAILSACSHAGLVSEGRSLFELMLKEYQIEPQMEHYACMVDLLGRAGMLREATEIVKNMPMEPNACVWGALLNSCRMYKNATVAAETASFISSRNVKPTSSGSYMLFSNMYAADGRWEDSATMRASARNNGLRKNPGQSRIEVRNKFYTFTAGNDAQNGMVCVYGVLEGLITQLESPSNLPNETILLQSSGEMNQTHGSIIA